MSDRNTDSAGYDRYSDKKGLGHAVRTMPRWKKILLVMSLVVGLAGLGVQEASSMMRKSASAVQTAPTHVAPGSPTGNGVGNGTAGTVPSGGSGFVPAGSSGFVGSGTPGATPGRTATPTADSGNSSAATPSTPAQSASEWATPYMTRIGFSMFVGVVVGFIFRTFVKMAAALTAVIVAIGIALSYFHVINVDLTEVKAQTASASSWIADQAGRVKVMIFSALPSSTAAGAGFIFGFKRR